MNNNRVCPNCRNPLPSTTCKYCGYKQVMLQVAEEQPDFGRLSFLSRVKKTPQDKNQGKSISRQEKLTIYLKQYQKLIKEALERLIDAQEISYDDSQRLKQEVKFIWQSYLVKKVQTKGSIQGMFTKYLNSKNSRNKKDKSEGKRIQSQEKQVHSSKDEEQSREDYVVTKKRGRPMKKQNKNRQLSTLTQMRCYFKVSVSSLIPESIEERKISPGQLTSAQKSFLSYLLGIKQIDSQLIKTAGTKYIKLLYEIRNQKIIKSYIKDSQIESELRRRGQKMLKSKEKCVLLILLIDLLRCWTMGHLETEQENLTMMVKQYEKQQERSVFVDNLLEQVRENSEKSSENSNIPTPSYQLIYSIIFVSVIRVGITLSLGEVITSCGQLQIKRKQIEQQLYLPGIPNEQVINVKKTRKTAHLLAKYLDLKFVSQTVRWTSKWCKFLQINQYIDLALKINESFFEKASQKITNIFQDQAQGRMKNYFRYAELEQDIASMAGIVILIKLIYNPSDYPYLLQFPVKQVEKNYEVLEKEQFNAIKQLLNKKQIVLHNRDSDNIIAKLLPEFYQKSFPFLDFIQKTIQINNSHLYLGYTNFNTGVLRFRNLSDLNQISSKNLFQFFGKLRQERHTQEGQQIRLRYAEMQHLQWINKLKKKNKNNFVKKIQKIKKKVSLSEVIKKQLNCIIKQSDEIVEEKSKQRQQCLLDIPSSNYELMIEYTSENLELINRHQLLYLIKNLCFNYCTYNQLSGWVKAYQFILRQNQSK